MAVVMTMEWPGVSENDYLAVLKELQLDTNQAKGLLFHVATFVQDGGMRVVDVWESPEAFQTFSDQRIVSAVQKVGVSTQPKIEFHPAYNIYAPGLSTIGSMGASSMP